MSTLPPKPPSAKRVALDAPPGYRPAAMHGTTPPKPEAAIRQARGAGKALRFTGYGKGVFLYASPTGTASWRWQYSRNGRAGIRVLGHWPDMSQGDALNARDRCAQALRRGADPKTVDPLPVRARGQSLEEMAAAWIEDVSTDQTVHWGAGHKAQVERTFRLHINPELGGIDIKAITQHDVRKLLNKIAGDKPAVATNARQFLMTFYDWAVCEEIVENNPVLIAARARKLPTRYNMNRVERKQPALLNLTDLRRVLTTVESSDATPLVKLAHRLIALTAVRKLEAQDARWSELQGDLWIIPARRMKMQKPHIIALAPQAAEIFEAARTWQRQCGIQSDYVFADETGTPPYRTTLNELYKRILPRAGFSRLRDEDDPRRHHQQHSLHGWRAALSTAMNATRGLDVEPVSVREAVEMTLAHDVKTKVGGRYDRGQYLTQQAQVWKAWADLLCEGLPPAFTLIGEELPSNVVRLARRVVA